MYPRSYYSLTVLAALTALSLAPAAHAQNQPKPAVTLPSDLKGQIGMTAGDYNFTHFDRTAAMQEFVNQLNKRSEHDLAYFKMAVGKINELFNKLWQEDIYGENGLKTYSNNSAYGNGKYTSAEDYLATLASFEKHKLQLAAEIGKLTSLPDALPSATGIDLDGKVIGTVQGYGRIDFTKVISFYNTKVEDITNYAANLPQAILPANTKVPVIIKQNDGTALAPNLPQFQISPGQLMKMQKDMVDLRKWKMFEEKGEYFDPVADFLNPYTLMVKKMARQFIATYGTDEKYRYDKHTEKSRDLELDNYIDYFYGRSFMRAYFGMPIGTIGVEWKTKAFNLDKIFSGDNVKFYEAVVWDEAEMVKVQKAYENVMDNVTSKTKAVFGANVNLIDRINSAFTWLRGNNRLAAANKMMFDLLYQDFKEERLLTQGKLYEMKSLYDARYKGTPEQLAYFNSLKPKYMNLLKTYIDPSIEVEGLEDNVWANGTGTVGAGESVLGDLTKAMIAFRVQQVRMGQADELAQTISLSTQVSTREQKRANKRAKDM